MPLKLVRLLAVLVAVAVPLQGMASVVAGQCMAFGHHDAPASQDDHAGHATHEGHDHEEKAGAASEGSHCGPCSACCASATISGPAPLAIDAAASSEEYVFAPQPPVRLPPDELDRPPLAL